MHEGVSVAIVITVVLLYYADMLFQATWWGFYFNLGVPIYRQSFGPVFSAELDPRLLEAETHDSPFHKMAFEWGDNGKLLLREAFFQWKLTCDYPKVMHASIEDRGSEVVITGRTSLQALAMVIGSVVLLILWDLFVFLGFVFLGMVVVGYAIQVHRYRGIGEYILSRSSATNAT